jgi:hypothetical protein
MMIAGGTKIGRALRKRLPRHAGEPAALLYHRHGLPGRAHTPLHIEAREQHQPGDEEDPGHQEREPMVACSEPADHPVGDRSDDRGQPRRESGAYEKMINEGRYSFLSAPMLQGLLEGGAPIVVENQVVGAVGVSGVKSSEDLQVAKAGIAAL